MASSKTKVLTYDIRLNSINKVIGFNLREYYLLVEQEFRARNGKNRKTPTDAAFYFEEYGIDNRLNFTRIFKREVCGVTCVCTRIGANAR